MSIRIKKCSLGFSLIAGTVIGLATLPATASSHREAPFLTRMPKVDATDFYLFRSYETGRANYVTMIADYIPLQDPGAGPNYYAMDPDALYEIHIDNNGDAKEDLTFQFRFSELVADNKLTIGGKPVSIPLIINGSTNISAPGSAGLNRREMYTVSVVRGDRRTGVRQALTNASGGSASFEKPVDNIGNKSIADYAGYAAKHIYDVTIPGCNLPGRMFVGQRKDPFVVNLGETFDLINIKAPATAFDANAERAAQDTLANKNVTAIALEVPTACLSNGTEPVIGGWTTASVRQGRLINPSPRGSTPSKEGGAWTQVSRLSAPLVNEVVIGLKDGVQATSEKF